VEEISKRNPTPENHFCLEGSFLTNEQVSIRDFKKDEEEEENLALQV